VVAAARAFASEVEAAAFPDAQHSYGATKPREELRYGG
jgi:ketopantoate hydroxymethyltransferase